MTKLQKIIEEIKNSGIPYYVCSIKDDMGKVKRFGVWTADKRILLIYPSTMIGVSVPSKSFVYEVNNPVKFSMSQIMKNQVWTPEDIDFIFTIPEAKDFSEHKTHYSVSKTV